MGIIKFNNVPSTTPGLEVETFPNYVAPEKEYQVTHVPGRNGDLVVDTKTYKNVSRSYKVSMAVEPPAVSVSGSTASFEATAERALAECKTAINSDVGKVGTTIINSATDPVENNEPYNFRAVPNGVGDRENDTLIGGTVAFNQHATGSGSVNNCSKSYDTQTNTITITTTSYSSDFVGVYGLSDGAERIANHKIFVSIDVFPDNNGDFKIGYGANITRSAAASKWNTLSAISSYASGTLTVYLKAGSSGWSSGTYKIKNVIAVDLTQMFGSTIADYIYGLETTTAGAGVAWFRNLFPKDYYAYNAGELISVKTEAHKMVGFNQWDEEWELGLYSSSTGEPVSSTAYVRSKSTNYIRVFPNATIYAKSPKALRICFYDSSYQFVGFIDALNEIITAPNNAYYIRFSVYDDTYGTTYNNDICINLSDTSKNGTYEPYEEHIYPLNPALELRGIPKLNSSNKLYYDGDIYSSDGSVIRKYGIVDLGSLDWAKATFSNNNWRFSCSLPSDFRKPTTVAEHANFVCSKYSYSNSPINGETGFGASLYVNNSGFYVMDMNYSDVTTFKTAMSGVYLIYELATPVIESTTGLIDNVSIASFDDGADDQPVNLLSSEIVAVESGSGEKSPTNPYSISGFDSGVVTRFGKNLFSYDLPIRNGYWTNDAFVGDNAIVPKENALTWQYIRVYVEGLSSITLSGFDNQGGTNCAWLSSENVNDVISRFNSVSKNGTKTVPSGAKYLCLTIYSIKDKSTTYHNAQLEQGTTATTYETYNGNTYTFNFGQTVYGGHFDNKGNLVVTHNVWITNGTETWIDSGEGNFYTTSHYSFDSLLGSNDGKSNYFTYKWSFGQINGCIAYNNRINLTKTSFASVEDLQTAFNQTPLVIVYPLANPIVLPITSQDIPTLLGNNNIFANTGNIKTLSYPKQVCPFEPAQEVDDHGTEEYIDNREVAIPVGHESKYFTAGKIYNFSWLDEAGLIKEGELNADTGVLTITNGYGIVDLGSLTWTKLASSAGSKTYFRTANEIPDMKKSTSVVAVQGLRCSNYPEDTWTHTIDTTGYDNTICIGWTNRSFIAINDQSKVSMTASTFKSAMHGIKLLYKLADPVRTIQLTPVQVESLIGHNILISESGNISVTPRTYSTYTEKMNAISDWLHSASGYARLEDTYEPDYYRKAYYDEQTDMENIFNEAGQATLNFVCKPQRYLKSGEEPITISSGGLIQNRTRYEAYPILKVTTNNTQGSVAIGNHSITIKAGAGTDPITIDCELQDAWSGTSNKNSYIVLTDGEFPVIDPGAQTVTFDGGVQSVEVIPRWWTV